MNALMALLVQPRLPTGPGRVQLLVLDLGASGVSPVSFLVNGVPTTPTVLRPLSSVRGRINGVTDDSKMARAFSGVYEFRGLASGSRFRITVTLGDQPSRLLDTWTLPEAVPSAEAGGFDVLLSSCYCSAEANPGAIDVALQNLLATLRPKQTGIRAPDCSLLMGDQVYLDLPTASNFLDTPGWLASKFEQDYATNWGTGLKRLLSLAPSACLPDDHEFWNNAPHVSPFIQNSYTASGRSNWHTAADTCFQGFAKTFNDRGTDSTDDPLVVDVHPLSIFLADGRVKRDLKLKSTLTPECLKRLHEWVANLNQRNRVGIYVSGQSLLREPVGTLKGKFADYEHPNYADYSALLTELSQAKGRLLLLTGDVHFGRVTTAMDSVTRAPRMHEVIVSPLSLVTTPVVDSWSRFVGHFTSDPWPRHDDPEPAPMRLLAPGAVSYPCATGRTAEGRLAKIKGDQLGLLSFDWNRMRLRATVKYFSVHSSLSQTTTVPLFEIPLAGT